MKTLLVFICAMVVCGGMAVAADVERPGASQARSTVEQLRALKSALSMLKLGPQEKTQTADIAESCDRKLDQQIETLKAAMKDKQIAETRAALSDEHRMQLDGLLNAMRRRDETIAIADQQFEARLQDIGLGDLHLGKTGIRDEGQLIERICISDKTIREKFMAIREKYTKERNDAITKFAPPDPKDQTARKVYMEQKDKLVKAADAHILQEARALLSDKQRAAISQAMDAQRRWVQIVDAAKAAFDQEKNTLLGVPPKPEKPGKK